MLDELAVIARPGAPSRTSETASVAEALSAYRPLATLSAGSYLEGGDVMVAGRSIYVGRSTRTNEAGIDELRSLAAPLGYTVTAVDLTGCLHLKSACTFVPPDIVLANPDWVSPGVFRDLTVVMVAPDEPYAAEHDHARRRDAGWRGVPADRRDPRAARRFDACSRFIGAGEGGRRADVFEPDLRRLRVTGFRRQGSRWRRMSEFLYLALI